MEIQSAMGIILDALNVELAKTGTRKSLCSFTIQSGGSVAADYGQESCGGMGWVRLANAYPSVTFPSPASGAVSCASTLAYIVEVGILRPAPIPASFGTEFELPSDDENANAALAQIEDMKAMHRALKIAAARVEDAIIGTYTPAGPDGGVVGGVWTVTLGLD